MEIGEKHGRLTCIGKDETRDKRYYLFRCECGTVKSIIQYNVKMGATKSCGCFRREHPSHTTYGFSHTRIDNIYKSMIGRCYYPSNTSFKRYGERGIGVCKQWKENKMSFFEWAFANGYEEHLTLDRIDNSKGYSPENCRWATYKEQANNCRSNRILVDNGEEHTLSQWADITGISSKTLSNRLKRGWTVHKALTTPITNNRGEKNNVCIQRS